MGPLTPIDLTNLFLNQPAAGAGVASRELFYFFFLLILITYYDWLT